MIDIHIYGPLWPHLDRTMELDLQGAELTVAGLLARLGIDPAEAMIVTIDRRQAPLDALIPAGGRVCIFPPISGG